MNKPDTNTLCQELEEVLGGDVKHRSSITECTAKLRDAERRLAPLLLKADQAALDTVMGFRVRILTAESAIDSVSERARELAAQIAEHAFVKFRESRAMDKKNLDRARALATADLRKFIVPEALEFVAGFDARVARAAHRYQQHPATDFCVYRDESGKPVLHPDSKPRTVLDQFRGILSAIADGEKFAAELG